MCREEQKNKEGFKACGNFAGQRKTTCPCFNNNFGCTENCRCCGCVNKFGKRSLFEGNKSIVPKKDLEKTFIIIKKIPLKIICYAMGWKLLKESGRIMKMCFCLWLVVVFLREILAIDVTLGNIYKFFNAVEKHLVIDGKYKIREKSLGQISSKIAYCKKLI